MAGGGCGQLPGRWRLVMVEEVGSGCKKRDRYYYERMLMGGGGRMDEGK